MVLIDTGSEPGAVPTLLDYARDRLQAQPGDIKYVFLTHWHGDHSGAAEKLRELTGAEIVCHQDDSYLLTGANEIETCWGKRMPRPGLGTVSRWVCAAGYRVMRSNTDPLVPDRLVWEGDEPFGPDWTVLHLPGHTPGSCGLWSARHKILFAGDTILSTGKRIIPPIPLLVQEHGKLYESWQKLSRLGRVEWILPGHFVPCRWNREIAMAPMVRRYASK